MVLLSITYRDKAMNQRSTHINRRLQAVFYLALLGCALSFHLAPSTVSRQLGRPSTAVAKHNRVRAGLRVPVHMSSDSATPADPFLVLGEKFVNGAGLLALLFGLNVFSTTTGMATMRAEMKADMATMRAETKAEMAMERAERKAETELTLIKVDNKFAETIFVSRAGVVISAAGLALNAWPKFDERLKRNTGKSGDTQE
ncbi:hypothetical protein B484DRAFT_452951 [Ochromonadaceae sp. CCMP2298]|nr:hypothetical protein B484DRAFT_452951 [Ochromonadaceae sp. CCMP2298]